MTAHTPRILTDAETSLIDAFGNAPWLPGDRQPRQSSLDILKQFGLPTRKVEAFHYTDLRALLPGGFAPAERPGAAVAADRAGSYQRLVNAIRLPIMDGHYFADLADDLPGGVSVLPGMAPVEAVPGESDAGAADAVATINTAFATDGVQIAVAAGTDISPLIGLANTYDAGAGGIAATRNAVDVGAGAKVRLLERFVGPDSLSYLGSTVTQITVGEGAEATYIIVQSEGDAANRLARLNVTLHADATLNLFLLNAGGKLVRQELNFDVVGEGANLNIAGINLVGGDAHIDVTSRITHHVASTNATETFRNVITGRGRGVFQGQIKVAQPAQLTDARMACNTLLLSDNCDFSVKPELEIFADDVQCAHGATVADLEDSYMFYLKARGISEVTARRMLIRAFVAELFEDLEDDDLVLALDGALDGWMDDHI